MTRVDNRTGVFILQHHREQRHPIGTARIARLALKRISVVIARRSQELAVCPNLPPHTGLLWPHPRAMDLATLSQDRRPENLVVLDGTWSQAKRMYRANPWLQALPHLAITPGQASRYQIRRQPAAGCLSTIEALVEALRVLEPETPGLESLLEVFERMVARQIACQRSARRMSESRQAG